MVVIDLERLFALPQHAGDLSVGHLVVVAEVENQPLLERQLQDRLLETYQRPVGILAALLRHAACQDAAYVVERGEEPRPAPPQHRQCGVRGDAVEPCPQFPGSAPEGADLVVGADEGFLYHILGILVDDDQPSCVPVKRPQVCPDQTVERPAPGGGIA